MNDTKQQNDGQARGGKRRRRRRGKGGGGGNNPQQQPQQTQQQPQKNHAQPKQHQAQGGKPRHQQQNRHSGKPKDKQQQQQSGSTGKMRVAEDLRKAERQRELNRPEPPFVHVEKRYAVAIFDTLQAAKADLDQLVAKTAEVDQLNVVIRAESSMDDPELIAIPKLKVFAGAAWTLIHERRITDGWYDAPR
ncbi:MAG: hypothetical protein FJ146_18100 [Deltaproteobacteria bacterium]|nr:hypothetical protein [Deltaproteobacteria bacterium]